METYSSKKNLYHRNAFFNEYKSNGIIYPNIRTKFSPERNILKNIRNKNFSSKYIYSNAKKNIKRRNNADVYKMSFRNMNLSLPKNINNKNMFNNTNKSNTIKKFIKKNSINNHFSTDKLSSDTLINNEKNYRNLALSKENIISKENNFFIECKNENFKYKNVNINKTTIDLIYELWDYLCVPNSYHELYNVILFQLDEYNKNILIKNEYDELNELKSDIDNLLSLIKLRKEILQELKGMNNRLRLIFKKDVEETNSLLVKQMSNKIEIMRDYTIKICYYMKKIKNRIFYGNRIGKYDLDLISNKFEFDKNYLIKMKEEMNFLKEGYAKYFFNITEDQTPFLVKASEEDPYANGDPFIHLVPMSKETKKKIEKCNYIIYQELIGYQNKDFNENKFRPISPMRNYNVFDKPDTNSNTTTLKRYNSTNFLLQPNKPSYKKSIFDNEFINKLSDNYNTRNTNLLLKENSCINFEIKNNAFHNLLKKNSKKK